ncbi:MAG: hypothetical protein H7A21_10175 [Spirochaetales bacterium]|nr:hypothetical protein [Leptospiraceae bacterium]MCP5481790.1 hypothetical protein [Spirochaetales bacterium]MCP5486906.1 hypothetical protein [Spirochaetales bacterium]
MHLEADAPPDQTSGLLVLRVLWIESWNGVDPGPPDWVGNFVHFVTSPGNHDLLVHLYSQTTTDEYRSRAPQRFQFQARRGQTQLLCSEIHDLRDGQGNWRPFLMPMPGIAPGHILTPAENDAWLAACIAEMQRRMDNLTLSGPSDALLQAIGTMTGDTASGQIEGCPGHLGVRGTRLQQTPDAIELPVGGDAQGLHVRGQFKKQRLFGGCAFAHHLHARAARGLDGLAALSGGQGAVNGVHSFKQPTHFHKHKIFFGGGEGDRGAPIA